jgi:hypothetical protein
MCNKDQKIYCLRYVANFISYAVINKNFNFNLLYYICYYILLCLLYNIKSCSYYRYIYTDSINLSSVEEASGVLYASKKYMLPHLSHLCHKYLLSNLRPSNALAIFEFSKGIQEAELMEACMEVSQY